MDEADGELRALEVRRRVELLPGGNVSRFTIADHLLERSTGEAVLQEWTRRGHYRWRRTRCRVDL